MCIKNYNHILSRKYTLRLYEKGAAKPLSYTPNLTIAPSNSNDCLGHDGEKKRNRSFKKGKNELYGTGGRTRTGTVTKPTDFLTTLCYHSHITVL